MKAVILSAGLGTRMQKAYPGIHKNMLPIGGKPLLERNIEHLKKYGFNEIYINLYYLPNSIRNYFHDGKKYDVKITYSLESELLGTAGALIKFKKNLKSTFVVLYGDILTLLDFDRFLKFHKNKKSHATLLIHETDHPQDSDLVSLNKNSRINRFYISPHPDHVTNTKLSSSAIYILEPEVLNYIPEKIPSDFVEDIFPLLLQKGFRMFGYKSDEYSKDIGTPDRYKRALQDISLMLSG